ncbi:MAG TPA: hypothetical protein PLK77_02375 [Pyrinomonadaceae bacterium]|nr:hypothetical protein [Pyrinomonadaceae bacterium]
MKKEGSMRKEYDLSKGKRGLLFGKVDTTHVTAIEDDAGVDEAIDSEFHVLESNLVRIESLRPRLSELDPATKKDLAKRLADAKAKLDGMAIPE